MSRVLCPCSRCLALLRGGSPAGVENALCDPCAQFEVVRLRAELERLSEAHGRMGKKYQALEALFEGARESERKATFAAQFNARQRDEAQATIARVMSLVPANERGFLRRNELLAALRGKP